VHRYAQRLAGGGAVDVLAAAGLRGVAGPAGRAAGAVFLAGTSLGVAIALAAMFATSSSYGGLTERVPALALVGTAAAFALLVAVATITLAAADHLVSTRRSLASLAAMGADPDVLDGVQRRRLTAVTSLPLTAGLLLGGLGYSLPGAPPRELLVAVALVVVTAAVALAVAGAVCAAVVRVLRPRIRAAAAPESLRVA
jgi:hypothetical protein